MRDVRATRVLELNPEHRAVQVLRESFESGDKEKASKLARILSVLAAMAVGDEVENPAEFADLVAELF